MKVGVRARFLRGPPCRIVPVVVVHLIDGTYELFRHFLSPAAAFDRSAPEELRVVRGVVASVLGMLEGGVTHLGVAADHVIESFRNALWPGDKTGEGLDPLLSAQFQPLEDALSALGVVVWPMVEFEADDALAAAAAVAFADPRVEQVVICAPDKDLAVRARRPRRPARSPHARAAQRVGGAAEVRRPARIDSRLARARRRPRERLPRPAGLGCQVRGDGARPLSASSCPRRRPRCHNIFVLPCHNTVVML